MQNNRFESHCHFFNIEYLILEIIAMIAEDKLRGFHDVIGSDSYSGDDKPPKETEGLVDFIAWFAELVDALFSDCNKHYEDLGNEYAKAFGKGFVFSAVPLMMDILYMFEKPQCAELTSSGSVFASEYFLETTKKIKESIQGKLHDKAQLNNAEGKTALYGKFLEIEDMVADLFDKHRKVVLRNKQQKGFTAKLKSIFVQPVSGRTEMSPGYLMHARELVSLQRRNKGKVFPFLAVDPRRRNVMQMIGTGKPILRCGGTLVSPDGPFYGIKFYPRLGYRPDDAAEPCNGVLREVVDYCIANKLPVVTHSGPDGFPPLAVFPHWKYEEYSNPEYWDMLMKDGRQSLKINLAHFGNDNPAWRETILTMMARYENVYTDVACIIKDDVIAEIKKLWDEDSPRGRLVRDRLMFGTDYDVLLLADVPHDLSDYFKRFTDVFSQDDLVKMSVENPRRFLGV